MLIASRADYGGPMTFLLLAGSHLLLFSFAMTAQTGSGMAANQAESRSAVGLVEGLGGGGVIPGMINPFEIVKAHPYSADEIIERSQTLADGTHLSQRSLQRRLYRDGAGRTRVEFYLPSRPGVIRSTPIMVELTDPVAGYTYHLNEGTHSATRIALPRERAQSPQSGSPRVQEQQRSTYNEAESEMRPSIRSEPLGRQTLNGIAVDGTRIEIVYPKGLMGNDQPIKTVAESWISPDLKIIVLGKQSDPRVGDVTTKLENLSLVEPSPSLFQVPHRYKIVRETRHEADQGQ